MLRPQLHRSLPSARHSFKLTSVSLLRANQSRSLWGWRQPKDWFSHLDPRYDRFRRIRTLKTSHKLLKDLRRRGKFNWDFDSRPFFSSRRWASHWDGNCRRRGWLLNEDAKNGQNENGKVQVEAEEDGYELSKKEKIWKEQMEAMRKRIETDPYEAIFGKRFEPFWSPLVPSWMREEMGLQGWPKLDRTPKAAPSEPVANSAVDKTKTAASEKIQQDILTESKGEAEKKPDKQPTAYSYASSTSWDSWTNKTRRVEWNSVTGQTKRYEYDPISNRMVAIEAAKQETSAEAQGAKITEPVGSSQDSATPEKASDSAPIDTTKSVTTDSVDSVDIPVKRFKFPPLSHPSHGFSISHISKPTALGPWKSTAVLEQTLKVGALAKVEPEVEKVKQEEKAKSEPKVVMQGGEENLEGLTAETVRASMGAKAKGPGVEVEAESGFGQTETNEKIEVETSEGDRSIFERNTWNFPTRPWVWGGVGKFTKLNESASVEQASSPEADKITAASQPLKSSIERMQSKELRMKQDTELEPDDAAAHESTEPITNTETPGVPKDWDRQAEMLQADRVRRTRGVGPAAVKAAMMMRRRELLDIKARKLERDAKTQEGRGMDEKKQKMREQANEMLKQEILEQRSKMEGREDVEGLERLRRPSVMPNWETTWDLMRTEKYRKKMTSLKGELETAYKQSSVHSEKHLERIRELETALAAEKNSNVKVLEMRYAAKIKSLRAELERAYKQSAVHSEKHLERIRYLEEEVDKAKQGGISASSAVLKEATGTTDATQPPTTNITQSKKEIEKAKMKSRDRALVREVRRIYENAYGVISLEHRQPQDQLEGEVREKKLDVESKAPQKQVVEVESDVDLGEALARYENENQETYPISKPDQVKNEEILKIQDEGQASVGNIHASKPISWQHPPLYKILAYDSGNDMMSTATTTSSFTPAEAPISIPQALSQLYAPAKFVPYFADLQKDGYQVIDAAKDMLVFKKVRVSFGGGGVVDGARGSTVGLEDHGLVGNAKTNVVWAADAKSEINPIDGTVSPEPTEPQTGNFASPTGFVNHDPFLPSENQSPRTSVAGNVVEEPHTESEYEPSWEDADADITWRHYPRVRREEAHFTGTKRTRYGGHLRKHRREERDRRGKTSALRWALGTGLGTAGLMYVVGAAAERQRETREGDWEKRAEETRRKYGNGGK